MIGHIFLTGVIGEYPGIGDQPVITLLDVVSKIHKNKDAIELVVHINSPGGVCELGYEIHAQLRSQGKKITTIIEGMCASIATVIAMAGDIRLIEDGSDFMIHNPWTETTGDADHLMEAALNIQAEEDKMIAFYHESTGLSKDSLNALMKLETFLTPEKAIELGFLTGIVPKQKAVALLTNNNMSNFKDLKDSIKQLSADILGALKTDKPKSNNVAVALSVTGGDGVIYTVTPMDGVEDGLVEVGDLMTLPDGKLADGNFIMPEGNTVVSVEGKIVEIIPAATAAEKEIIEPSALEKENAELKDIIAELKKSEEEGKAAMEEIKVEQTKIMAALGRTTSSYKPPIAVASFSEVKDTTVEVKNSFADAAQKRKQNKENK